MTSSPVSDNLLFFLVKNKTQFFNVTSPNSPGDA